MASLKCTFGFSLIALAAVPAAALADCGAELTEWKFCSVTSDCALERDKCYRSDAVNKKHVAAVQKYNACVHEHVRCEAPPADDTERTLAVCLNGTCAAVKPEKKAEAKTSGK